jgi:hypothetical protein
MNDAITSVLDFRTVKLYKASLGTYTLETLGWIRVALLLKCSCRLSSAEPCTAILELRRGNLCELWLRCQSSEDFFRVVERALNEGSLPVEAGFPTGHRVRGYALSHRDVVVHGEGSIEVSGEVELEYYRVPSTWLTLLKVRRINLDPRSSRAHAVLAEPVSTATLFDAGVRLVRPLRVPL